MTATKTAASVPTIKLLVGGRWEDSDSDRVGESGSKTEVLAINPPPEKAAGQIIED